VSSPTQGVFCQTDAPAIGPVLGGIFAETLGWRAIFWFLVIASGTFLIAITLLLPETLRSIVGNGSKLPYPLAKAPLERLVARREAVATKLPTSTTKPFKLDFIAPLRILVALDTFFLLLLLSIHYATWQMSITSQSSLFAATYGLGEIDIGLTFLANGFGCMIGTLTTGKFLDREYAHFKRNFTGDPADFPIEQARLRTIWFWSPFQWASVLVFGWTLDRHLSIAAPIIASFTLSWSAMSIQSVINTFLVDIFPDRSASATAALNLARCLVGAVATGTVDPSISAIGVGWTFTVWTGLMVISLGLVGVQIRFGARWRRRREAGEMLKKGT
jgi:MFS family permease